MVTTTQQLAETPFTWPLDLAEQSDLQATIHEKVQATREQVILALHASYYPATKNAARTMATCSNVVRFYIDPDAGKVRPWMSRCRQRLCPLCGKARSTKVARQLKLLVACMKDPRHLVLTVKSSDLPLTTQLDHLRNHLCKLRRSAPWALNVSGGVYVIESTWNAKTERWHPHLHVIYDGKYFPFKQLQRLWHDITGGSDIVWLRRVDDQNAACNELSKYVSKPAHLSRLPDRCIREYHAATRGRRMLQTFGHSHGQNVSDNDDHQELGPATYAVSLNRIVWLSARGAATPQKLIILLAERFPLYAPYIYQAQPQLQPPDSAARTHERLAARLRSRAGPSPQQPADPGPGRDPPDGGNAAVEKLDAKIFLAFTRYRLEDQAGKFATFDTG